LLRWVDEDLGCWVGGDERCGNCEIVRDENSCGLVPT
jgi:hypothetical protein